MSELSRKQRRRQGGQAIMETVMALLLLCLILFGLLQVAHLYTGKMIAHHTAFVMARSYVVGYDSGMVGRAKNVGSIGMAGDIQEPSSYTSLGNAQLGQIEPDLIAEYLGAEGYHFPLRYQHWDRIHHSLPVIGAEGMSNFRVRVRDYPVEMPFQGAYMAPDYYDADGGAVYTVDFDSEVRLYNHAGYYLY